MFQESAEPKPGWWQGPEPWHQHPPCTCATDPALLSRSCQRTNAQEQLSGEHPPCRPSSEGHRGKGSVPQPSPCRSRQTSPMGSHTAPCASPSLPGGAALCVTLTPEGQRAPIPASTMSFQRGEKSNNPIWGSPKGLILPQHAADRPALWRTDAAQHSKGAASDLGSFSPSSSYYGVRSVLCSLSA